jgi:hypothetical protein
VNSQTEGLSARNPLEDPVRDASYRPRRRRA